MTTGNWTWGGVRNARSRWRVVGSLRSSQPEGRSLRHLEVVVGGRWVEDSGGGDARGWCDDVECVERTES